jgi:heme exporter protein B
MQASAIWILIRKDMTLEWRQHSALSGILLYLVSTVFLTYLAFDGIISEKSWNALFWIIMLFAAINAILKAFIQEHENRHLFYYTIVSPKDVIIAKIIYNAILMMLLGIAGFGIFLAFMGNPTSSLTVFFINMLLGMLGFSSVLCLVSAIAARVRNNFTLMAVLGFPLVLPLLLLLIRVSGQSINGTTFMNVAPDLLVIVLLIAITIVLSNILFPYIWKE